MKQHVYFAIYDFSSVEELTQILKISPDRTEIKGQDREIGPNGASVKILNNAWIIDAQDMESIDSQFDSIFSRINQGIDQINSLTDVSLQFSIVINSEDANSGFNISAETLANITKIKQASIDVDHYYVGED